MVFDSAPALVPQGTCFAGVCVPHRNSSPLSSFRLFCFQGHLELCYSKAIFQDSILCSHPVFTDWPVFRPPLN